VSITLNCDQLECLLNWVRITRLNIVYQALFKFNHKSVERRLPVSDCHGPFFWCVLDSRVDDFLRWVIDWKQLALLNRLADNAVQRSDRVSRVNNLFDVSRIFKQCVQVVPVRMPCCTNPNYSTVTDFAKLRGWSISVPLIRAT
jgi:hypothetical protein